MDANFVIKMIIRRMENIERDFKRSMLEDTYLTVESIDNAFMTDFYTVQGMKTSIEEMIKNDNTIYDREVFRDEAYSILDGIREYYLKGLKRFRDMNN